MEFVLKRGEYVITASLGRALAERWNMTDKYADKSGKKVVKPLPPVKKATKKKK